MGVNITQFQKGVVETGLLTAYKPFHPTKTTITIVNKP
jgi:hypothetical protein